ncbi:MAG: hypothetical protein LBM98_00820 [Oscillospiraceae bacterium]|nr:hypothetical protein [Oscillospiraceae bacterium]
MTVRRDGGRGYVARDKNGIPPRRYAAPLPRGEFTGEGGFETRPYVPRRNQTSKLPSLIFDIC